MVCCRPSSLHAVVMLHPCYTHLLGGSVTRVLTSVIEVYSCDTQKKKISELIFFWSVSVSVPPEFFFPGLSAAAEGNKSDLTPIAPWGGEMRQTHSHGHFGYSKHGQGKRAVAQMDG